MRILAWLLASVSLLLLSACANQVPSADVARLQRGTPAQTVSHTLGQPGQRAFLAQRNDIRYEGRFYRVDSDSHLYLFIYRNNRLWKITKPQVRSAEAKDPDSPNNFIRFDALLRSSDCQTFVRDESRLVLVAGDANLAVWIPLCAAGLAPFLVIDAIQEPAYAALVAKYDPDRIQLGESTQALNHRLGPPTCVWSDNPRPNEPPGDWREYRPAQSPLLFQNAGHLRIKTENGKVTAVFAYPFDYYVSISPD